MDFPIAILAAAGRRTLSVGVTGACSSGQGGGRLGGGPPRWEQGEQKLPCSVNKTKRGRGGRTGPLFREEGKKILKFRGAFLSIVMSSGHRQWLNNRRGLFEICRNF